MESQEKEDAHAGSVGTEPEPKGRQVLERCEISFRSARSEKQWD